MKQDEWLDKIKTGDKESFRYFYEAYAASPIRTASAITRNREMAKDMEIKQIANEKPEDFVKKFEAE